MPASRPTAVCFDLDGTLIDSEPLWIDAEVEMMARMGANWTHEDQVYCLGGPLDKVAARMQLKSGHQRTAQEITSELVREMCMRLHDQPVPWLAGAQEAVIDMAEQGPVALVTASPRELVEALVGGMHRDLGLEFAVVLTGDDLERTKPHPDPYLHAAHLLAPSPMQVLVVEDSVTGCTSAASAGCAVVARTEHSPIDALSPELHAFVMHMEPTQPWGLRDAWLRHPIHHCGV